MVHLLYFHFLSRADITKRPFKLHLYLPFCNPLSADAFLPAITICAGRDRVKEVDISGEWYNVKNNGTIEVLTKLTKYDKIKLIRELDRITHKHIKTGSDAEYRVVVNKFLNKCIKMGVIEWLK